MRSQSKRGAIANRGTCAVCRRANLRLRVGDGKVGFHGKTAASPRGCAGSGQAPLRGDGTVPLPGGSVIGFTAPQPPPVPELPAFDDADADVQLIVEPREPPPLKIRSRSAPPDLPPIA